MRKKITPVIIAAFVFISYAGMAKAISSNAEESGSNQLKKEKAFETRNKWKEERCERFKERFGEKVSAISEKREKHSNAYGSVISKLENVIRVFKAKGYDTTELTADLATLKEKIATFKTDYDALAEKMSSTEEDACTNEDTHAKYNLGETRTLVQKVRSDAKAIKQFYKSDIKPDIQTLRKQYTEKNGTEETE